MTIFSQAAASFASVRLYRGDDILDFQREAARALPLHIFLHAGSQRLKTGAVDPIGFDGLKGGRVCRQDKGSRFGVIQIGNEPKRATFDVLTW